MDNCNIREYEIGKNELNLELFPDMEKKENFRPLKIFISYGHPESEICDLICACLTKRGHFVWYDSNEILPGNDWRASILNGITGCDTFVAGLSKHYIRDNSVCLDELSIAIGVKKGNIKTILLEEESVVKIPGSVSCVQWLDMHDWNIKLKQYDEFVVWFRAKMKELIETLEAEPDRNFCGQIENLKKRLRPYYSLTKQTYLLSKAYSEREWINSMIEEWLCDWNSEKICVIYGAPGSGKSIFAANYVHYNARVAASIFCESDKPQFNNVHNIIRVLAYQLACRLPEYRIMLEYMVQDDCVLQMNESELFDYLITQPLNQSIDGGHEPMCILIDGLDESGDSEKNILAEVLKTYSDRLPRWLKILLFSRPESSVVSSLCSEHQIILDEHKEQNLKDITIYVKDRLKHYIWKNEKDEAMIDAIVEKSQGIFLYADVVIDSLLEGKITEYEVNKLPIGLSAIFYHWFTRIFQDTKSYQEEFADVFGVLLASDEPLPKEEICKLFGWKKRKIAAFIRKVKVVLKEDVNVFGKETIEFSHLYIKEWLSGKGAGKFQCYVEDGLEEFARYYLELYKSEGHLGLSEYGVLHIRDYFALAAITLDDIQKDAGLFWHIMNLGFDCDKNLSEYTALQCYQKALVLLGEGESDEVLQNRISALTMVGLSNKKLGQFLNAEKYLKEALGLMLSIYAQLGDEAIVNTLICYENYASFLNLRGKYKDAEIMYKEAINLVRQSYCKVSKAGAKRRYSKIYSQAAINLRDLGQLEKSNHYFEIALKILESIDEKNESDKDDIIMQKVNLCIVEDDLGKGKDYLAVYNKYLEIGKCNKDIAIEAHAYELIGRHLQSLKQFTEAKNMFLIVKKLYDELTIISDDIVWKENRFINMADIATCDYMLDKDITVYERAIKAGEALCEKYFLARSVDVLWRLYNDYIHVQDDVEKSFSICQKAIKLIDRLVQSDIKTLGYKKLKYFYVEFLDIIRAIGLIEENRLCIYKQIVKSINSYNQSQSCIDKSDLDVAIYVYEEIANCFETIGLYNDLIDINDLIISMCEQHMLNIDYNDYIITVTRAYISNGRAYEKKEEFEQAYNSYLRVVEIQKKQEDKDLYAIRRIYFSLNDCGRMKVMLNQYRDALPLYERALGYIEILTETGAEGEDGAEKENYELIINNITWLKNELEF